MKNDSTEQEYWQMIGEIAGQDVVDWLKAKYELDNGLETAKNYYQQLLAIKRFYLMYESEIIETHNRNKCRWYTSYPTDWSKVFTPIEQMAWQTIRAKGRLILYPQYPVLKYHLDFGNPGLKIGLELDGEKYHNKERDVIRDAELKKAGWTIFRITGKEMHRTNFKEWCELDEEYDYEHQDENQSVEDIRHWIMETGDGVIEAIKEVYFSPATHRKINPWVSQQYISYCHQTLEIHQY